MSNLGTGSLPHPKRLHPRSEVVGDSSGKVVGGEGAEEGRAEEGEPDLILSLHHGLETPMIPIFSM